MNPNSLDTIVETSKLKCSISYLCQIKCFLRNFDSKFVINILATFNTPKVDNENIMCKIFGLSGIIFARTISDSIQRKRQRE